jgi:hypothetical protein
MAEEFEQARQAWEKVVAAVKDGPMNLPLWQALEHCVGLAIRDDTFFVGMDTQELHRASVIKAPQAMAQVESAAQRALGARYHIEIIEGQDPAAVDREVARAEARREQRHMAGWCGFRRVLIKAALDLCPEHRPKGRGSEVTEQILPGPRR